MSDEKKEKTAEQEKRNFFRVDDIISVVASPVQIDEKSFQGFAETAMSSKAFSLMDVTGISEPVPDEIVSEPQDNSRLYRMMTEIKTKLDFIINHIMLEKEGLLEPEKKFVNISASGIRFTVDHPVKEGDIMEIKLLLPTYPPVAVFAYGEVKRVIDLPDNQYDVAIEYINMEDSVRNEIVKYTMSHQRETIRKRKEAGSNE